METAKYRMPRIFFIVVQIALLVGIAFLTGVILHKQTGRDDFDRIPRPADKDWASDRRPEKGPKPYAAYQAITRRDLFQTPPKELPTRVDIDLTALKPTELKLKLWGTITGEDGLTRAVIEDQTTREQAFFRAGEEVASAKIKMILREKVVLSVNGKDEILEIEQPTGRGGPGLATRAVPSSPAANRLATAPPVAPSPAEPRSIRMKLSRLGPISDDPQDWAKEAAAEPYLSEEGETGLMMNRITPSSPLRRLGIRNGDVIVSINDQPVTALGDIFETLMSIAEGETLRLNVKRRGRERQIDFQFD